MSSSEEALDRLKLGGVLEEVGELGRAFAQMDEYQEAVVKLLARMVELQERQAGIRRTTTVVQTDKDQQINIDFPGGAVHRTGTEVNVASSDAEEEFTIPVEASNITINADDADNPFEVAVIFRDAENNEITRRDKSNSSDYQGDSTTDVFVKTDVASPFVKVVISGSANNLDYSIYAR